LADNDNPILAKLLLSGGGQPSVGRKPLPGGQETSGGRKEGHGFLSYRNVGLVTTVFRYLHKSVFSCFFGVLYIHAVIILFHQNMQKFYPITFAQIPKYVADKR
jgi:hypothetical protein